MHSIFILKKIIEILIVKDGLTVPQIQYQLTKQFDIAVHQRTIVAIINDHKEIMDVINTGGHLVVILTAEFRSPIKLEKKTKKDGN